MKQQFGERFFDCCSESEDEEKNVCHTEHQCRQCLPSYSDDPVHICGILQRAAASAKLLLNGLGVHPDDVADEQQEQQEQQRSCSRFYPATLEISARLHTDAQCLMRGDPVTLKLPMELDPCSGQVNVKIFQPKPITKPLAGAAVKGVGAGDRHGCSCIYPSAIHRSAQRREGDRKSGRRVRWPDAE